VALQCQVFILEAHQSEALTVPCSKAYPCQNFVEFFHDFFIILQTGMKPEYTVWEL